MRTATEALEWHEAGERQATSYVGMIIALASWLMLFASLIMAYAVLRVQQAQWPPAGTAPLPTGLGLWNTGLLLASSAALARASKRAARGDGAGLSRWTWVAFGLGTGFLAMQTVLWSRTLQSGIVLGGLFGSIFYALTVLHALHVLGGLGALAWLAARGRRSAGEALRGLPVQPVGMYWHFVDVVWIVLFVAIFLI
jgi:cytochrome c oxidase subunit 3